MKTKFYPLIRILGVVLLMLFSASLWAQTAATLPARWVTSADTPPQGFSTSGTGTYSSGLQLSNIGSYIQVKFEATDYDKLVELVFRFGNNSSTADGGVATLMESSDGTHWTAVDSVAAGTAGDTLGIYPGKGNAVYFCNYAMSKPAKFQAKLQASSQYARVVFSQKEASALFVFELGVRKDYRESVLSSDLSGISATAGAQSITGGTLKLSSTSLFNNSSQPVSPFLRVLNYARFGSNGNHVELELTEALTEEGSVEIDLSQTGSGIILVGIEYATAEGEYQPLTVEKYLYATTNKHKIAFDLPVVEGGIKKLKIGRPAADGTTFYLYGVSVNKLAGPATGVSTKLSDLKIDGTSLEAFNKNVSTYNLTLASDASSSPVVSATAEAATGVSVAMLPANGQVSFDEGETVDTVLITVTETGSDPVNENVYRVIFTKDVTPPTATVNYTEGASLPRSGNIVLTFSEKVSLISDCTHAVQLNGTDVVGYALDEATSTVLTIPFADGNWNEENTLALAVAAGALVDDYKNTNALIAYNYVFDETAPQLLSSVPAHQSTTALLKGTITLTFNENVKLSENPGITLKVGAAEAVNVTPTVESKKMTLNYGDVNKPNTDYVLTFPTGSILDAVGNANTEALVLSFKSDNYLNVFPYISEMSAADFAIPGWMLSVKGYSPTYVSGCASAQPGGYRMDNDEFSETSQVLDLYLSKAGVVTFNFSSTGNRLYVMANSANAKKDTIIVRKNDCISYDYVVEVNEPVIVSCYAVLGEMTDDRGTVNITGSNKTVNVYGVKVTAPKHPVEDLTPLLGTATAIAKDGFQAHWTKVAMVVDGYKVYASTSKSAIDDALEHKGDNSYYQVLQQTIVGDVEQATLNNLDSKTKYYYFVDAFVVVDQDSIYSLPSKVDSITTTGAPVISEYTENKLPLTGSSITVSFDENISLVADGPVVKMEVDSATSTAVTLTTTVSEKVLTLAYSTLQNNTAYRVVIPAGALQGTNYVNDVDTLYFESVNTEMAPRITSVVYGTEKTPLDGAQEMEIDFVASLEVDRPDVERDASVALRLNGVALAASAYQDAFTLHLQGLEYDSTYTLIIPEGAYKVTGSTTLKTAADTVIFKTKILYVEDVVYYTDFATTTTTPMMARYADSIVKYDLANSRIEFTGENQVIDGFTLATSGKKYQIYGYATNSTAGQENNLSYGRLTLNNSSSELTLPTFTGPFKMMWSINNGNTNLRVMALRENTTVLQLDSVGSDEGIPDAKLCYYEFTGTESKTFNFFSQKNAGQLQDLEIIKTVASSAVTPLVNHWKGLVHDSMAPISYADFRFNKRVKLADIAKITATGARIDSVKIFGNSVRPYYRATDDNADVTITIAVGALVQETTEQALQEACTISFKTRAYFNGKAITQMHRGKDTATINALAIQLSLTDSTAKIDSLVLSFVASEKAVVTVDNVVQVSGKTANDFTSPVSYVVTSEKGETATYVVTISRATSNRKEWNIQSCKIYPNPASTSLFVESENVKNIQILDMSGRIILEKKTVENKERIHVSDFKPGLYFVRMTTTSNQVQVAKFVKK